MADDNIENSCRENILRYGSYVKAIIVNKAGSMASREDIEDCVSDVFAEIYRSPQSLPSDAEEMKALLVTVAKRRGIDLFRRLRFQSSLSADSDQLGELPSGDDTETEVGDRDMKRALWKAVEQLGDPDSAIIVYQYFYRKKVREIAEILSMSAAAVHKRSFRARQKIKEELIRQGY